MNNMKPLLLLSLFLLIGCNEIMPQYVKVGVRWVMPLGGSVTGAAGYDSIAMLEARYGGIAKIDDYGGTDYGFYALVHVYKSLYAVGGYTHHFNPGEQRVTYGNYEKIFKFWGAGAGVNFGRVFSFEIIYNVNTSNGDLGFHIEPNPVTGEWEKKTIGRVKDSMLISLGIRVP